MELMMTRDEMILKILQHWSEDADLCEDDHLQSYTDASCGYQEAQDYVSSLLEAKDTELEYILAFYAKKAEG